MEYDELNKEISLMQNKAAVLDSLKANSESLKSAKIGIDLILGILTTEPQKKAKTAQTRTLDYGEARKIANDLHISLKEGRQLTISGIATTYGIGLEQGRYIWNILRKMPRVHVYRRGMKYHMQI